MPERGRVARRDLLNARSNPHDWWKIVPKSPWPGPGVQIKKVSPLKILLKLLNLSKTIFVTVL